MKRKILTLALCGSVLFAMACTKDEVVVEEVVAATKEEENKHEFKVDEQTGKVQFSAEIVYFGFDESTLTEEGMERLQTLANHMKDNESLKVRIEGHCDARGSVEYNLALGQRRAESVRSFLKTHGIESNRILAVSFGQERPAVEGEGEEVWSQNRRAEFTFIDQKETDSGIRTVSDQE